MIEPRVEVTHLLQQVRGEHQNVGILLEGLRRGKIAYGFEVYS